ncbi:MAG: hypothetical protein WA715_12930 [Candidatus Acidiferrum sp.]
MKSGKENLVAPVPSQERQRPVARHIAPERPVMLCPVPVHCAHFPDAGGSHSGPSGLSPRRSAFVT